MLVEIIATGNATHTSHPDDDQAVVRLSRALGTVARYRTAISLNPLVRDYFAVLAESTGDRPFAAAIRRLLAASGQRELDAAGAEVIRSSGHPWIHKPMLYSTFSFVGQRSGVYTSIVPSTARAEVRIGFVPGGDDPGRFVGELRRALAADRVTVRVVGAPDDTEEQVFDRISKSLAKPASTTSTDVFDMWRAAVGETYPNAGVAASQFEAGTSAGPWRAKGIPVYGLYPFAVDGDTADRMHGNDERVAVQALRTGTDLVYRMLSGMRLP